MNTTAIMQIIVANTSISKTQYDKIKSEIQKIEKDENDKI